MSYATRADIDARYPGVIVASAPLDGLGVPDASAIALALEYADNAINECLGSRYAVPLALPLPAGIVDMAVDLALARLLTGTAFTEERQARHDQALDRLRALGAGRAVLVGYVPPDADGDGQPDPPPTGVRVAGPARTFSRDTLADW